MASTTKLWTNLFLLKKNYILRNYAHLTMSDFMYCIQQNKLR